MQCTFSIMKLPPFWSGGGETYLKSLRNSMITRIWIWISRSACVADRRLKTWESKLSVYWSVFIVSVITDWRKIIGPSSILRYRIFFVFIDFVGYLQLMSAIRINLRVLLKHSNQLWLHIFCLFIYAAISFRIIRFANWFAKVSARIERLQKWNLLAII